MIILDIYRHITMQFIQKDRKPDKQNRYLINFTDSNLIKRNVLLKLWKIYTIRFLSSEGFLSETWTVLS